MASLFCRNGNFYAQFYDTTRTPQRKRFSLKTSRKSVARERLAKLEKDAEYGEFDAWSDDPFNYDRRQVNAVSISNAIGRFIEQKSADGRAETTISTYQYFLGQLEDAVGSEKPLQQLQAATIKSFVEGKGLAQATIRGRYGRIKAFLNWCQKKRFIVKNPIDEIEAPQKPSKLPKAITQEDLCSICNALKKDYEAKLNDNHCRKGEMLWMIPLFWFGLFTGMRISEIARLRWSHVDTKKGLIYIFEQKNKKQQTIPLNKKAREILATLEKGEPNDFVFRSPSFKAKTRSVKSFRSKVTRSFTRYRKKAKIERHITFHSLRHSFCTMLAEAGKSAVVIKEAARHADISTSMRYVHLSNQHLKAELDEVFS